MDKINPMSYIVDTDPVPEAVLDASGWFETEYMTIESSDRQAAYLEWYMAQGWIVYNETRRSEVVVVENSLIPNQTTTIVYKTFYLKRRKLQSERVLNDLIRQFTNAYNEGRSINDQRYDEIVSIYNVMLDKTEDDISTTEGSGYDYTADIEALIALFETDFNTYVADVDGLLDDYGAPRLADINIRFDNELSKARQTLIDRGLNNTTVWASVSAGIERERERALSDAEDKIVDRKILNKTKIHEYRTDFRNRTLLAYERLMALKRDNKLTPLKYRNDVLSAMLNFMERRSDEYPGLEGLANIAAQLGYGEAATSVAPSV